jgi:hypothetical protein
MGKCIVYISTKVYISRWIKWDKDLFFSLSKPIIILICSEYICDIIAKDLI